MKIGDAIEIVGKVNPDLSVKVLTSTDFGENLGGYSLLGEVRWEKKKGLIWRGRGRYEGL